MTGSTISAEGVLTDLPKLILPNIVGEPKSEALIDIHKIIRSNAASISSNIGGGRQGHLALMMAADD